jgi:hypothetical protein
MPNEPPPDVQELAQRLLLQPKYGGGRGRHSPLFWWLFTRADDLRPIFDRTRATWDNIAAVLPDTDEIRDGAGKRPAGERLRKTWFAVCQAKGWGAWKPSDNLTTTRQPLTSQRAKPPAAVEPIDDDDFVLTAGDGTIINPKKPK